MNDRAHSQGRELVDVVGAEFLKVIRDEGRKIAPTPDELTATAKKIGWRLRRKPGVSPGKELARRIRSRGTFARKWQKWKTEGSRTRFIIWLIDLAADSEKVDRNNKVSNRASAITTKAFQNRLNKMADKLASMF